MTEPLYEPSLSEMSPEFQALVHAVSTPVDRTRAIITAAVICGFGLVVGIVIGYGAGRADGLARRP